MLCVRRRDLPVYQTTLHYTMRIHQVAASNELVRLASEGTLEELGSYLGESVGISYVQNAFRRAVGL